MAVICQWAEKHNAAGIFFFFFFPFLFGLIVDEFLVMVARP
jgi:hypothetical protein